MKKKTDNTNLDLKVDIRLRHLPDVSVVRVLDLFAGYGHIWDGVRKATDKQIRTLRIDHDWGKGGTYLLGDNRRYLPSIDIQKFDVIDVDAYGQPFDQVAHLFDRQYRGIIHITIISAGMGALPHRLYSEVGIPLSMVRQAPTLVAKKPIRLWEKFFANRGVRSMRYATHSTSGGALGGVERFYVVLDTRDGYRGKDEIEEMRKASAVTLRTV